MTGEERLRDLIGGLYETVADIRLLPRVLKALADELGAASGVLFVVDSETGAFNSWSSMPIEKKLIQALHENFGLIEFIKKVSADTPKGAILTRQAFLSDREYGKCALFRDVLSHVNVWDVMADVFMRSGNTIAMIGFIRPRRSKPFDDDKFETYRRLAPHIERSVRLYRQVARLEVQRNDAAEVLDRLPLGVMLVDAGGRVITMNRSASELAKRADGLRVDGGGVCRAEGAKERARLAELIARAAEFATGAGRREGEGHENSPAVAVAPVVGPCRAPDRQGSAPGKTGRRRTLRPGSRIAADHLGRRARRCVRPHRFRGQTSASPHRGQAP